MTEGKPTPMDIMQKICPAGMKSYLEHRDIIMDEKKFPALPRKIKLLVGIGVAASLQSSLCTLMWTRLAKQAGASDAEIAEAILVARLMKMATVNDAASEALAWLDAQKK